MHTKRTMTKKCAEVNKGKFYRQNLLLFRRETTKDFYYY